METAKAGTKGAKKGSSLELQSDETKAERSVKGSNLDRSFRRSMETAKGVMMEITKDQRSGWHSANC